MYSGIKHERPVQVLFTSLLFVECINSSAFSSEIRETPEFRKKLLIHDKQPFLFFFRHVINSAENEGRYKILSDISCASNKHEFEQTSLSLSLRDRAKRLEFLETESTLWFKNALKCLFKIVYEEQDISRHWILKMFSQFLPTFVHK